MEWPRGQTRNSMSVSRIIAIVLINNRLASFWLVVIYACVSVGTTQHLFQTENGILNNWKKVLCRIHVLCYLKRPLPFNTIMFKDHIILFLFLFKMKHYYKENRENHVQKLDNFFSFFLYIYLTTKPCL